VHFKQVYAFVSFGDRAKYAPDVRFFFAGYVFKLVERKKVIIMHNNSRLLSHIFNKMSRIFIPDINV